MEPKKKIAVIGGGIAGLTFARCLGNEEFEIHIFEKKENFGEIGAAISVFPNALCVVEAMGLLQEVLENSGEIREVYLKTAAGSILTKSEPRGEYPTICMHRAELHRILLSNIRAQLYTNAGLQLIEHMENGQLQLTFVNGEIKIFDAVIGADGVHSVVREHIINDGMPVFRGCNIWRGVVKTDFESGYGSETYGKGQRVGIVPIKDGVYGWWATCNEDFMQDDGPESTKDKLLRLFGDWHYPIPELIEKTPLILKNGLSDRIPRKGWTRGHATLIGDAAHPTTPNLGQGGCMAIEGAYLLAKCIGKYGISEEAFQRYEALQFPRSEMIVNQSLKIGKIGQLSNLVLVLLRNLVFRVMPSAKTMKMMDKFFSYRVTKLEI